MFYDDFDPIILRNIAIHTLPVNIFYILRMRENLWWLCFTVRVNLCHIKEEEMNIVVLHHVEVGGYGARRAFSTSLKKR